MGDTATQSELSMDAEEIKSAIAVLVLLPIMGLIVWSIVWAYRDAERRGKPGWAVALMVMLITWPIGLIVWIVFRPDEQDQITD
jgi:hypothetical protein